MIKVIISGILGKMGSVLLSEISKCNDIETVCGIDIKENSELNIPVYSSFFDVKETADIVVDYSSPNNLENLLNFCKIKNIPCILCTTGYNSKQVDLIKATAKNIPVFLSSNMSLGINSILCTIQEIAKNLCDFDVEIIEKHHNEKVDSPSGTAILLANSIKKVCPEKQIITKRTGKRNKNEIGIQSVRGGNIVGEHEIIFAGIDETITITHQAYNKSIFALGTVLAIRYMQNKEEKLYSFTDLLKNNDKR